MSRTLLIMAGGTGGHIMPALAVAKEMAHRDWHIVWLGARGKMEETLVPQHRIELELLSVSGVRGRGIVRALSAPLEQIRAIRAALKIIATHRPDVVIGFGGFTSFAGGVAAWLRRVPLAIHEQNSVPGLANKLLARLAKNVMVGFPNTFGPRARLVGNPVRDVIATLPKPSVRFAGRNGPLRILVVGGSLGAQALNEVVPKALALLSTESRPLVTHQAGVKHLEALRGHYAAAKVEGECVAFIDDMTKAYASADLVIARSGALTIAELAAAGVGAILVPFPYAVDDHQTGNAQYLASAGAAMLIQQDKLTADWLAARLRELNRPGLLAMAEAARRLAKPNATSEVANMIEAMGTV